MQDSYHHQYRKYHSSFHYWFMTLTTYGKLYDCQLGERSGRQDFSKIVQLILIGWSPVFPFIFIFKSRHLVSLTEIDLSLIFNRALSHWF